MCHGQYKGDYYGKRDKHAKAIPYNRKTKHKNGLFDEPLYSYKNN